MSRLVKTVLLAALSLAAGMWSCVSTAHEVRPALLQITERADGHYDILWKQPSAGLLAARLIPRISGGLLDRTPDGLQSGGSFVLVSWSEVDAGPRGMDGRVVSIEGLSGTLTDVLVLIRARDGTTSQQVLEPSHAEATVLLHPQGLGVGNYLPLGIEHILSGADHLGFVLALVLLVRSRWSLLKAISAFTLAHSLTLAGTALHVLNIAPAVVEALIALSVVFVAVEVIRKFQGTDSLAARRPWVMAFCFGLLHGAGFAGALAEVGLPQDSLLSALLLFNLGVEVGQLLFVGAVLLVIALARRWSVPWRQQLQWAAPYAVGSLAVLWFIERLQTAVAAGS